ncbi:NusA-like transcription termination signal-binding factor [Stetteria hydrogenophila]
MSQGGKITVEEMRYISIIQDLTGALVYRCLDRGDGQIICVVKKGDAGKVIGRRGSTIRMLRELLKKDIDVVEYSEDLVEMVKNLFPNVKIKNVKVVKRNDSTIVVIHVPEEDKGRAIGRGGRVINRARLVLRELFDVSKVIVK